VVTSGVHKPLTREGRAASLYRVPNLSY